MAHATGSSLQRWIGLPHAAWHSESPQAVHLEAFDGVERPGPGPLFWASADEIGMLAQMSQERTFLSLAEVVERYAGVWSKWQCTSGLGQA